MNVKNRIKKLLSSVLIAAMVCSTALGNTLPMNVFAADTLKAAESKSKKNFVKKVSNGTYETFLEDTTGCSIDAENVKKEGDSCWVWDDDEEQLGTDSKRERMHLGDAYAADLKKGTTYSLTYVGVQSKTQSKTYDIKVAYEVPDSAKAIPNSGDSKIAIFDGMLGAMRYRGYTCIDCTIEVYDHSTGKLITGDDSGMFFRVVDIDCKQACEILSINRVEQYHMGAELDWLGKSKCSEIGAEYHNTVYCESNYNEEDVWSSIVAENEYDHDQVTDWWTKAGLNEKNERTADRYCLYVGFSVPSSASHSLKLRFYAGGNDTGTTNSQTNGVFFAFDTHINAAYDGTEATIDKYVYDSDSDAELSDATESFYYTLQSNLDGTFGSYTITDTFDNLITPVSVASITLDGTDVTDQFKTDISGQTLTITAQNAFIKDEKNDATLKVKVNCKINIGATIPDSYIEDGYIVIPNKASLDYSNTSGEESSDESKKVTVRIPLTDLTIDKVADTYEYQVGDTVNFTITVNSTTANAYNVVMTDTIPSDLSIQSVSTSGASATHSESGQTVTVSSSKLGTGESLVINITCTALASGNTKELYNTANATCWNILTNSADDDAEVFVNSTDLSIEKVADKYEYEVGDTGHFTVTVRNTGDGFARDVVVEDVLPDELSLDYDSVSISGVPDTFTHYVAGTEDPTNELNPDNCNETETENVTANKSENTGNGWKYEINLMPAGAAYTITFDATMTEAGNGKELVNSASAEAYNADKVEDDAEVYINTASLTIAKKYINEYQAEKDDNRADNEFRVYEEETGYELVKYQVDVESVGVEGTVAKDVSVYDLTLPDGLLLNFDDIEIVETSADGKETAFTSAGGNGTSFEYKVAGTADPANELNPDNYNETETRTPVITLTNTGNNWTLSDTYLPTGYKLTITYTCRATEDVNGMEIRNTAKTTCANMTKDDSGEYEILKDTALVYINSPRLVIEKTADSYKYNVGDVITYTINVYNSRTGTIARNMVYTDEIQTEGVKLQNTTVCLMDTDGIMMDSSEYKSKIGNNAFTLTTPYHLVVDENYSLWDIDAGKTPEVQSTWNPEYINVDKELLMTIEYEMVITDKDLAGDEIYNVATAVSDEALLVSDDETVVPDPPDTQIKKTADTATYYPGEDVTYTLTVTQEEEDVTAHDVMIKDYFEREGAAEIQPDTLKITFNNEDITDEVEITYTDAMDGFTIATGKDMEHGDIIIVTYVATVGLDMIGEDITNTGVAWPPDYPEHYASYTVTEEGGDPNLEVTKESDKDIYQLGETGHYTVTVTETEEEALSDPVVINDAFETAGAVMSNLHVYGPDGEEITDDVEITWLSESSYIIDTGLSLGYKDTITVTYDVLFTEASETKMINTAWVPDFPPVTTTVEIPEPEPGITKESDKKRYVVGETGHYTATVTQEKEDAVAKNVVITDEMLVEGPEYVEGSIKIFNRYGDDITDEMISITINGQTFEIVTGMDLEYGEFFTVTYDVSFADPSLNGMSVPNVVRSYGDNFDISSDNEVGIPGTDLTAHKSSNPPSESVVYVGDEITYTISITNNGEEDVENVLIRDLIPEHTEFVSFADDTSDETVTDEDSGEAVTDEEEDESIAETEDEASYDEDDEAFYDDEDEASYGDEDDEYFGDEDEASYDDEDYDESYDEDEEYYEDDDEEYYEDDDEEYYEDDDEEYYEDEEYSDDEEYYEEEDDEEGGGILSFFASLTGSRSETEDAVRTIDGEDYVTFVIDSIPAGGTVTRSFVVRVVDEGYAIVENTAEVKVSEDETPDWDDGFTPTNTVVHYIPNIVTIGTPELSILKTSDKEVYDMSDVGHYTVVVTETSEGMTAENVIIKDALENPDYANILSDTIKILDPEGSDITDDVEITADEKSYEIVTNRDLSWHEFFTVTYDVEFLQESLGERVKNTAKATAENLEVMAENDVTPRIYTDEDGNDLLEFVKTSDPAPGTKVAAGDEILYTINVTNIFDEELTNILVMDEVPYGTTLNEGYDSVDIDGKEYVTFVIDSLEPGESADCSFAVTVNEDAAEFVENTALIYPAGDEYDPSADPEDNFNPSKFQESNTIRHPLGEYWVEDDNEVEIIAPSLSIVKTSDKTVYKVGETGEYKVVVSNTTPDTTAINVVIKDELQNKGAKIVEGSITLLDPEGNDITNEVSITQENDTSYYIETGKNLAYGETFTVNYQVLFEEDFLQNTQVKNIAKAKADNAYAETDLDVTPREIEDGLWALKTSSPANGSVVEAGQEITYTITLTNEGEEDKNYVYIMDKIPDLTTYVEGSGGEIQTVDDEDYVCFTIESIPAGGEESVSFSVTVNAEATEDDEILNVALVSPSHDEPLENPWNPDDFTETNTTKHPLSPWVSDENIVDIDDGTPKLAIEKTSDKGTYAVGETGEYQVVVSNEREDTVATNVVIKDELEEKGATIVEGSITLTDTNGNDITNKVSIEADDLTYYIETGMDLAYGETFTVNYQVLFGEGSEGSEITNVAAAKADNASAIADMAIPVEIEEDLYAVKTADPASGTVVKAGDKITYTITLTNEGTTDKTYVYVMDKIPDLTTYVEGSGGEIQTVDGIDYVCFTVDTVPAGESVQESFAVTVNEEATENDDIINVALVSPSHDEPLESPWNPDDFIETNTTTHPLSEWVTDDNTVSVDDGTPELGVKKESDKDTYAVGETGHYTVTVSEDREDSVAHNVVISDELQVDGAKIQTDTITLIDARGNEIPLVNAPDETADEADEAEIAEPDTVPDEDEAAIASGEEEETVITGEDEETVTEDEEAVTEGEDEEFVTEGEEAEITETSGDEEFLEEAEITETSGEEETTVSGEDEAAAISAETDEEEVTADAVLIADEHGYTITTNRGLAYGELFIVTYDVLFEDEGLAGGTVANIATATSDETTTDDTLTVNIDDGEDPRLVVDKTSDKSSYSVGDTGTYTIVVTNDREGTVAENVRISDEFDTTGMKVQKTTFELTDEDGIVTEPASLELNSDKNGWTMETGLSLTGGKSLTVTYEVKFTDETLKGKDITNVAVASADNAKDADDDATVSINSPKTKATGGVNPGDDGKNGGSGGVKTSDVLKIVLVCAIAALAVGIGVYQRRKRMAFLKH